MANTSASGGPLLPSVASPPLEGRALNEFLQQWLKNIIGIDGKLFRPRWQAEPPNIPDAGDAWVAFGVTPRTLDKFPFVGHDPTGQGSDQLQRNQELTLLCSFYDLGTNGLADYYAALLADGLAIAQNREPLLLAQMGLVEVGDAVSVPVLLKTRWLYRVDMPIIIRRMVTRTYAVETLLSASGTLKANPPGSTEVITRPIVVSPP